MIIIYVGGISLEIFTKGIHRISVKSFPGQCMMEGRKSGLWV